MNNEYNKNNSQRKNMVYGYIRVSSDKQTVENQRFELQRFCDTNRIEIDGWIEETISGTKNYKKRELGTLLSEVDENDLIICTELSRLGRNLFMIMEILNLCMSRGCRVWTVKDGYRLGDDIQSKVLAFAFGLKLGLDDTDRLLKYAGYSPLYARNKRDAIIISAIDKKGSIFTVNEMLYDNGFKILTA